MNLPSRNELQDLLKHSGGTCISLFMPTYRTSGADRRQGPVQLQNLLDMAEGELIARATRRPEAEQMLEPARALARDTMYWQNGLADGLAIFISPRFFRDYKVPLVLDERLFVDDRFHATPLLPLYSGDTRFYILALSQNEVRLLEGNRHEIYELEPRGLPKSLVDALQKVESSDKRPHNLHDDRADQLGHGSGLEHVQQRLVRYFREIDANLLSLIGGAQAPLVLAGVEHNVGVYRQVCTYRKLAEGFIDANPEMMNPRQLHAEAIKLVEPYFRRQEEIARQQFEKLGGTARVTTDASEIVTAAQNGRIDTLFLREGYTTWGRFDPAHNQTQLHDRPENGDAELASVAAEQTFLNGGAVFFCDEAHAPRRAPMAALLRY
jgi:hypothetical protein